MKVLIKAPFGPYSGWGQDGIGLAQVVQRSGNETFLLPVELTPPLPPTVLQHLGKPLIAPFDLLLAHVAADRAQLSQSEISASTVRVLWSMWEWTTFRNHPAIEAIATALRSYHVVAAYDPVSAGALSELLPADVSLIEVQGGFDPEPWTFVERSWDPPIRFLLAGHLSDRKNPEIALQAFAELLQEHGPERFNSELHFKIIDRTSPFVQNEGVPRSELLDAQLLPESARGFVATAQNRERVFLHFGTWSQQEMKRFYSRMHCLLAPSRGEAKNLVALEFLSTGGPVIATNFGGHTVWLDDAYAYSLRQTMRPATWPIPTVHSQEAEPDLEDLKRLMWRVCCNPEEARSKGETGAAIVPVRFSWDSAFGRVLERLKSLGFAISS